MSVNASSKAAITIRLVNGERCIYRGTDLIGNIYDHRKRNKRDHYSTILDNWMVAWITGRSDWHSRYSQARDNALKGI